MMPVPSLSYLIGMGRSFTVLLNRDDACSFTILFNRDDGDHSLSYFIGKPVPSLSYVIGMMEILHCPT